MRRASSRRLSLAKGRPPKESVPAAGCARPVSRRSRVVLPAPFGPTTARHSPPRTSRSSGPRIVRPPACQVRPRAARSVSLATWLATWLTALLPLPPPGAAGGGGDAGEPTGLAPHGQHHREGAARHRPRRQLGTPGRRQALAGRRHAASLGDVDGGSLGVD